LDGADFYSVDVDPDGGLGADGCDGVDVVVDKRLREIDVGSWSGLTRADQPRTSTTSAMQP
jgi:hypothetical protein